MVYNRNKYKIVLFRNGERNKVFFSSNNKKSILTKYSKFIEEKKPKFITEYISRKKVMFELAIITTEDSDDVLHVKDNIGRSRKLSLGNSEYSIIKILPYWKEEYIYDHNTKTKITFSEFFKVYLSSNPFKQVFTLNNKLVIHQDDSLNVFSLKTVSDSIRLLRVIEVGFLDIGRYDCLFVVDSDTVQRKQLYDLLESKGYKRSFLQKQYTY